MKKLLPVTLLLTCLFTACKPEVQQTGRLEALITKAEGFARADRIDSALHYFSEAATIDSTPFEVLYGLGFCYAKICSEQHMHCTEARHYLEKAVKLDSQYKSAYYNLFLVYKTTGENDKAMLAINRCIGLDSTVADYYRGRASLCLEMKDTACACQNMEIAYNKGDRYINVRIREVCKGEKVSKRRGGE